MSYSVSLNQKLSIQKKFLLDLAKMEEISWKYNFFSFTNMASKLIVIIIHVLCLRSSTTECPASTLTADILKQQTIEAFTV